MTDNSRQYDTCACGGPKKRESAKCRSCAGLHNHTDEFIYETIVKHQNNSAAARELGMSLNAVRRVAKKYGFKSTATRTFVRDDYSILRAGRTGGDNKYVRQYIIRFNLLTYACEGCSLTEWQGKPLTLDLDHIDGDNTNYLLSNLRFLCPNCHRQTDTWGSQLRS